MRLEVAAPGKLVLLGEYAVVYGAPAAVMAVDRRARVTISAAPEGQWTFVSPGLTDRAVRMTCGADGSPSWSDRKLVGTAFALVESLVESLSAAGRIALPELRPAEVILDTRSFFTSQRGERQKLGLGSSAALTTALANALVAWSGGVIPRPTLEWLNDLVGVHRRIQGGRGSGIDVAASLMGGALRYAIDGEGRVDEATSIELPGDLQLLFVWTGRSASTGRFLERLEACRAGHRRPVDRVMDRLGMLSERGLEALSEGDGGTVLEVASAYGEAMEELGRTIGMEILSPEHRRIRQVAEQCGVAYKPSGAGGGDFGLALARADHESEEFVDRVRSQGFQIMDLELDSAGCAFAEG